MSKRGSCKLINLKNFDRVKNLETKDLLKEL